MQLLGKMYLMGTCRCIFQRDVMSGKKSLMNNSWGECTWNLVLNALALLFLGLSACCNQIFPFYFSALIQGLNNLGTSGVGKASHKNMIFRISVLIKVLSFIAMLMCGAYIYFKTGTTPVDSPGYGMYVFLDSFKGCMITLVLLAAPVIESCVEFVYYVFSEKDNIFS